MRKLSILTIFSALLLLLFVPLKQANADGVFLPCKSLSSINFKTSGFLGTYNTALIESLAHWNTIPQVNVGTNSSSVNTLTLSSYSDTWFGNNAGTCVGSNLTKSTIRINSRTIANETTSVTLKNFARSTITHEIAHSFGLDDNPKPSDLNSSLMNHERTRTTIYNLTSYDKYNIDILY